MERLGIIDELPRAYHELALIYNDLGNEEAAQKYFADAGKLYIKLDRKDFQWTWYLALYGNILMIKGKIDQGKALILQSIEHAKNNPEFNLAVCEFVGCMAYISQGELQKGIELLEHSLSVGRKVEAKNLICQCCWVLSNVYAQVDREKSVKYAVECFSLAAKENYIQVFLSYKNISFPIIKLGLELGLEKTFLDKIVFRLGSRATQMLSQLAKNEVLSIKNRAKKLLIEINRKHLAGYQKSDGKSLMYVYSFGAFEVYRKDEQNPVIWKTPKAMELFAYFVNKIGKTIDKEIILEDIWPNMDPVQTSTWLHTYVYQIRAILKQFGIPKGLIYKNKGYCLNSEGIYSDHLRFITLYETYMPEISDLLAAEPLEQALALYQGEYLEGCYSQWATEERNVMEKMYLSIRERLAKINMQDNDYKKAAEHLSALLEKDPLSERANTFMIHVYEKTGDRIAAITLYENYSKTLEHELGIEPQIEMTKVYQRLKKELQ